VNERVPLSSGQRLGTRSGQRVALGDGKRMRRRLAICVGLQPVAGGLFAVPGRGLTVLSGHHAMFGDPQDDLSPCDRTPSRAVLIARLTVHHRQIADRCGLISSSRRDVAGLRDRVSLIGDL
jgi:hypothetical protein